MILQALTKLYDDLLRRGEVPSEGWSQVKVGFALCLDKDGALVDVVPTMREVQDKKGKTQLVKQEMRLPTPTSRSSGVCPQFLCDNSGYFLGVDKKGKPQRTMQCFEEAKKLHLRLLRGVASPVAKAVVRFFETWDPEKCRENVVFAENEEALTEGSNLIFRVDGTYAQEDEAIQAVWQTEYDQGGENTIRCLVSGEEDVLARLHPMIKGVSGAQTSGAAIVTFNSEAFCSYEREQGANAPIGKRAAFAYTTALNYLLSDRDNTQHVGDTTVVCWADGAEPQYTTIANIVIFGKERRQMDNDTLHSIVKKLASGMPYEEKNLNPNCDFYILGIAPNASRLAIRFFYKGTFGELLRNVVAHHERMAICGATEAVPMWKLLNETVNLKSANPTHSPAMESGLFRAVTEGTLYPAALMQAVMLRIRAERRITPIRAGILKAYYSKNKDARCPEEVLTMSLNENSTNVPYTLGRLFAVYEAVQEKANPGINATIKDKYFSAAASTPAHIFPVLERLSGHHLRKLNAGAQVYYKKMVTELMSILEDGFPVTLGLPEQGSFYLGYYHQKQKQFEKKEDK